jgi:hypothetical protein
MRFSRLSNNARFTVLVFCATVAACAPVQPWERGRLAQSRMALDSDALLEAMNRHTYTSKEAASGGVGPSGGGCGCN